MELVIYVDRLKDGSVEKFKGTISTDFLGTDPLFGSELSVSGEAYVTGEHLILKLQASTEAKLPCSICNGLTCVPLKLTDFYHAEPISEIPSVFDFSELLRQDLLLQLPLFAECEGNCPEREEIKKFLKKETSAALHNVQFPFSDL
jgi:uncharacterized metal-binding protein YceD (DUF177 family)